MKTVKAMCQYSTSSNIGFFSSGDEVDKPADHIALTFGKYGNKRQILYNLVAMLAVVDPKLTQDELIKIPEKTVLLAIKGASGKSEITKNGITYNASFKKSTGIAFLAVRK